MAVWIKQGVCGDLVLQASEGLRKMAGLAHVKGEDLFITSIREGTHSATSFHPSGRAFDMRPLTKCNIAHAEIVLGKGFDVIDEKNHWHVEYDPK